VKSEEAGRGQNPAPAFFLQFASLRIAQRIKDVANINRDATGIETEG
jgi:hypothetical protein